MRNTTLVSRAAREVRIVIRIAVFSFSILVTSGASARAQLLDPAGVSSRRSHSVQFDLALHDRDDDNSRYPHVEPRLLLGITGAFAGTYGGWYAVAFMARGCHGELCELGPVLLGALGGSALSSALMAALPTLGSSCDFNDRFGAGIVGALGGTVAGLRGLFGGPLVLATVPLGGGLGAGVATASCSRSAR